MNSYGLLCIDVKFYEGLGFAPVVQELSRLGQRLDLDARALVDEEQVIDFVI